MTIGIEEIDRLEDAVIGRPDNIDTLRLDMRPGGEQRIVVFDLECDMLHPLWRIMVTIHRRLRRQFEEGKHVAHAGIEKHVHVWVRLFRRRHHVFGKSDLKFHVEHALVEINGLLRILAAIGYMMNSFNFHRCSPTTTRR